MNEVAIPAYRSQLFIPGHRLDWILKSSKYHPDALWIDLEDSVGIDQKEEARGKATEALNQLADDQVGLFVRLNGWKTGHLLKDLDAVVTTSLDGVILAKAEGPEQIVALDHVLSELETDRHIQDGSIEIVPCIESPAGIYHTFDICRASARVRRIPGLMIAAPGGDYASALNLRMSRDGREGVYFGIQVALAARAAGVREVIGGPVTEIEDLDLVREVHANARDLGATGGQVIHPFHVSIVNEVYSPTLKEVESALEIISEMEKSITGGSAALRLNGEMVDYAHVRSSLDLLERAKRCGLFEGAIPELAVLSHKESVK